MKVRIISAAVGLVILGFVLAFFDTAILNAAVAIISAISVYELLNATNKDRPKFPEFMCVLMAAAIPFSPMPVFKGFLPLCAYILVFIEVCILIKYHKTIKFEQFTSDFFFSFVIPVTYTMFIYLRDKNNMYVGLCYVLIALAAAWTTDTGAYFVGVKFGKHKLCPEISPKKTIEGAVGGVVFSLICMLLICFGMQKLSTVYLNGAIEVNYIYILIFAPILSFISMIGDMAASIIKRQHGIKDFGNIMPGHGGIVDRFDSVLMVLPAVYLISNFFPFVK